MTVVTSAVLFRSESKGSGFHANKRKKRYLECTGLSNFLFLTGHLNVDVGTRLAVGQRRKASCTFMHLLSPERLCDFTSTESKQWQKQERNLGV